MGHTAPPPPRTAAAIDLPAVESARYAGTVLVHEEGEGDLYAAERWYVPSVSDPANPREVLFYRESLLCPCPAFVHRSRCRHVLVVAVARGYRFWRNVLAGSNAAELRSWHADKGGLIAVNLDVADSRGAQLAAESLLAEMGEEVAA